ncbi:hypothetical protein IC757_00025 [Wenzhouxiangella sp. AB-CW3]|uniref:hypothetical protein n=1 Tax=Wenzhouxiangella sp. AB-CW3 TaxID=2771012 RepID=UPI00168B3326|nr:hypothetical protein [Wenzhouxiangella sp. AB-CW3]QOC22607.1 hypothetical protein IC757_00025 [Wenzhouxiangella sp. AB-CW3]
MARIPAPVLIERTLLLAGEQPAGGAIDALIDFQRAGRRVLLIAPRPRRWRPTRNSVDQDLAIQKELHRRFSRSGAELDGICYLAASLFSRRPDLEKQLNRISQRYACKSSDLVMIGCEQTILQGIVEIGGQALAVGPGNGPECPHYSSFKAALKSARQRH